jgi:Rrf2 family transcriptional repressor of oqxAB
MTASNREQSLGSTWFTVSVRALVWLAQAEGICPSSTIATAIQAHATFLRRVFIPLVRAGIVQAREGRDGGYGMGRPSEQITLGAVFRAVRSGGMNACDGTTEPTDFACESGASFETALKEIMAEGEEQFIAALDRHTIAELVARATAVDYKTDIAPV